MLRAIGLFLLSSFEKYYGIDIQYETRSSRYIGYEGNIYIGSSIFSGLSSSTYGGAIQISTSGATSCLIEECVFKQCVTSSRYGGGVFFNSSESGSVVFDRVCSAGCHSASDGWSQFANLKVNENQRIEVYYLTVADVDATGVISIQASKGRQIFENCNFSKNVLNECCGPRHYESTSLIHKYCTCVNNQARNGYIYMVVGGINNTVYRCNIISNTISQESILYNYNDAVTTYIECVINNNKGTYYSIIIRSGTVTLDKCFIEDFRFVFTTPILIDLQENTHSHIIDHYFTANCVAPSMSSGLAIVVYIISGIFAIMFFGIFCTICCDGMGPGGDYGGGTNGSDYNYGGDYGGGGDFGGGGDCGGGGGADGGGD